MSRTFRNVNYLIFGIENYAVCFKGNAIITNKTIKFIVYCL